MAYDYDPDLLVAVLPPLRDPSHVAVVDTLPVVYPVDQRGLYQWHVIETVQLA
jgi:hypothetical protein